MATAPADRYASVGEFQEAIRQYWSHAQSVLLADRAAADLAAAEQREDYDRYARALLGFQEAYELWTGNQRAKDGIVSTSLAYAKRALSKGNFDLAASLLDASIADHAALLVQIRAAQKEQDARQQRLKAAKRTGVALMAAICVVVTVAFFWIRSEYNRAEIAKNQAEVSEKAAIADKQEAEHQKSLAVAAQQTAETEKFAAIAARKDEEKAKGKAIESMKNAVAAQKKEKDAKDAAVIAQEKEEYGAYIARIGLASAKIDENAFDMSRALLKVCPERLRNWEWGRLMHLCRQSDVTINSPERIETLALSPDGKRFVMGGQSGTAQVWDVAADRQIAELKTGGQYIFAAAFSPDGKQVALGTNDRPAYLKVFDAASGHLVWEFTTHKAADGRIIGHEDAVLSVAYSGDGKRLLTGSYDNTARLWDVEKHEEEQVFRGHDWWVWSAAFSPDERWIVTASQDGTAMVWEIATGEARATFRGHTGPVYDAVFAPSLAGPPPSEAHESHRAKDLPHVLVASAGYDKQVMLWWPDKVREFNFRALEKSGAADASGNLSAVVAVLRGHTSGIRSVAFSDDGQLLASGSNDNTVRIWDVASGQLIKALRGHGGRVRAVAFAPGGQGQNRRLFSGGHDQEVRVWDLHRYEEMRIIEARLDDSSLEPILGAAFSPDGQQVVTACRDRAARLWDRSGRLLLTFRQGHQYLASNAVFYPDQRRLLTAAMDNTARVWDIATGSQLLVLHKTGANAAVTLSHNGKWILTGGDSEAAAGPALGPRLRWRKAKRSGRHGFGMPTAASCCGPSRDIAARSQPWRFRPTIGCSSPAMPTGEGGFARSRVHRPARRRCVCTSAALRRPSSCRRAACLRPAATTPLPSGISCPGPKVTPWRRGRSCGIRTPWHRWRSRPTAAPWSPPAPTRSCAFGTWLAAKPRA